MNSFKKDPYAGYASCPDTLRAFMSYSNENQARWIEQSEATIREYLAILSSFKSFQEVYTYLAIRRHQIAVELKQRNAEGRTDYYGAFRESSDHTRQMIAASDGEQYWKWQKNKVFELTEQLIMPVVQRMSKQGQYEDDYIICLRERVAVENNLANYYCISIKSPYYFNEENHILSTIELFDFDTTKKSNIICIEYTLLTAPQLNNYYHIANQYYQGLLDCKDRQTFFAIASKLAYLLAHLLLVKQGNAGITEWILRGLAFKNGFELGYFNYAEGISWDFKAILTPNKEVYTKWFTEKAFTDFKILSDAEMKAGFSFKKSEDL